MPKSFNALPEDELIESYLAAKYHDYDIRLSADPAGKAMLSADPSRRARIVAVAIDRLRRTKYEPMEPMTAGSDGSSAMCCEPRPPAKGRSRRTIWRPRLRRRRGSGGHIDSLSTSPRSHSSRWWKRRSRRTD